MVNARDAAQKQKTSTAPPRVHVQLACGLDADAYGRRYSLGKEPDETPYGFHLARDEGFSVSFSRDAALLRTLPGRALRKFFRVDALHAFFNRDRLREADIVWTMTEHQALGVALLFALGIVKPRPIIANAVWLFDQWEGLPRWRRAYWRYLSRYLTILTVHSAACLPVARRVLPELRCELSYFGINADMFPFTEPRARHSDPIEIFSLGTDSTRDWPTLLEAFGNDERFHLTIMSPSLDDGQVQPYGNVTLRPDPAMEDFHNCYKQADIVAIVMRDNVFSGITVALEAAALGTPLLVSRTGGVPTYFDEEDAFYVRPDDPIALRETLLGSEPEERRRRAANAQRRFRERDYSTRAVVRRYAALTRSLGVGKQGFTQGE